MNDWKRACSAGGQCVEVRWQTACTATESCVEISPRLLPGTFAMRDSKDPDGPVLEFDSAELDAFAKAWLAGEFQQPDAGIGSDQTVTTTQAATILGVSRPTVARFCDEGRLPYAQPGRHRILRLADVLEFKAGTAHGGDQ